MTAKLYRRMRQQDPRLDELPGIPGADPMGPAMRPIIPTIPDMRLA